MSTRPSYLTKLPCHRLPEKARQNIDQLLTRAGWTIQDRKQMNLGESLGVAVREYPMSSGPTDYLLFIDRRAVGVIEAKPEGTTLSGVSEQTEKYLIGGSSTPSSAIENLYAFRLRKHG